MPQILVIRHSLAQANEEGILMGAKFDSPLSEKGREVAAQKGRTLLAEGFMPDRVFTSELTRAKQTADIIIQELGITLKTEAMPGFNERDFGVHDGKPYLSVLAAFETYGDNPPTVEPATTFVARVMEAFQFVQAETTGVTLIVTHSNPEMVMQTAVYNPDATQEFWKLGDPAYCEGFTYTF